MSGLQIEDGTAYVWFAYDIGQQIDLDLAERTSSCDKEREVIRHQRRAPTYLQFRPPPLRIDEACERITVGDFTTESRVEATLYDFGAISITYRIALGSRPLEDLVPLAEHLDDNAPLTKDSQTRARVLLERLGTSVRLARLAELVEDYVVFHVRKWATGESAGPTGIANRAVVARILRADRAELHDDEIAEAMQCRIAYGKADELVVDWSSALLFDARGEDTLAVLEFANVELLEMRFLDDRLDSALDQANASLRLRGTKHGISRLLWSNTRESLRKVADLQTDSALLFESVNNAIKMIGDHFLARVYRVAARRQHLADWDASILRKLQTLESIYSKLNDDLAARRMEVLEWIVIVLILVSIVLPFVAPYPH